MSKTKKRIILTVAIACVVIYFFVNIFPHIYIQFFSGKNHLSGDSSTINLSFEDLTDTSFIAKEHHDVEELTIKHSSINDLSFMNISTLRSITFENCTFNGKPVDFDKSYTAIYFNCCEYDFIKNFEDIDVKYVGIVRSELENLSFIFENFHNMTDLAISLSTIKSFQGIKDIPTLEAMGLYGIFNEDISEIAKLKSLKSLSLNYLTTSDISFIRQMNIESLTLDNLHSIRDIDFITEMPKLTNIQINSCEMAYSEKLVNHLSEMKNNTSNSIIFNEEDLQIKERIHSLTESLVDNSMSDREKVIAAISYICNLMSYDMRIVPSEGGFINPEYDENVLSEELVSQYNNYGLKSALDGKGVCLNYAEITTVLLNKMGITAYSITNGVHIWNLVQIDDEYFWIDVTSIDSGLIEYDNINDHPDFLAPLDSYSFLSRNFLFNIPPQIYDETHSLYGYLKEDQKKLSENALKISS